MRGLADLPLAALLAALLVASTGEVSATPPVEDAGAGPRVVAIELRSDGPVASPELLRSVLTVSEGASLTPGEVESSLRALAATGLVESAEAWERESPGGVTLVFVLRAALQVRTVRVAGDLGLDEARLLGALPQKAGQPLVEDRVLRGLYRLDELYRTNGYFRSTARLRVTTDPGQRVADLTYQVAAGPRAVLGEIAFTGDLGPVTRDELLAGLRLKSGDGYRRPAVREAPERLQRRLHARGYRLATVEPAEERLSEDGQRVDLTLRVTIGPKVDVEVRGGELRQLEKRDLLPFLGPYGYDEALVLQALNLIRRDYQQRGHYKVRVERSEERTAERILLRLDIEPGPLYQIGELRFEGNASIGSEELARRMTTGPRRALRPRSGRLVDEVLAEDLTNLRSTYALAGHAQARIGSPRIEERGDGVLDLTVPISEGPRRTVETLTVSGVESLDPATAAQPLPLSVGGPYHRILLDQALEQLRSRYESAGFAQALVSSEVAWDESGEKARVRIAVLEGTRTVVDRVIVRGNRRTRSRVLRRLIDLPEGTPISPARLLAVERDLYRLGLFSRVDVDLAPGPEGAETRGVVVEVEEGRTRRLSLGAGYDSDGGARGLLTLGEANLAGLAGNLQLDLLASQKDSRFRLVFAEPRVFGWPWNGTATTYWERLERDAYDLRRWGTQVGLSRERRPWGLRLVYDYHIVELPRVDDFLEVPVGSRNARVSSLTPVVVLDQRDDALDPRRGWNALGQLQYAAPFLSADAHFLKLFLQGAFMLDLGRFGTLATGLRGGAIEPFGDAPPDDSAVAGNVPIDERFFAGGRSTHRAFEQDLLGVPDETVIAGNPVGGNGMLLVNLDWRFPIAGDFGGTLFVDGGNVWRDRHEIDTADLRWGAGVGVRYRSPVGPLRLEVGWNLDRAPGESPYVWFISLGNPF